MTFNNEKPFYSSTTPGSPAPGGSSSATLAAPAVSSSDYYTPKVKGGYAAVPPTPTPSAPPLLPPAQPLAVDNTSPPPAYPALAPLPSAAAQVDLESGSGGGFRGKGKKWCDRGGRRRARCACCNCCGIPVFLCRLIWGAVCLVIVAMVVGGSLIGVFGGYCFNGGKLVRSESGTLDLTNFTMANGGAAALQVLGQNYGRIILQTAPDTSSAVTYRVDLFAARTPDPLPAPPRVETAGSRWTLYPLGNSASDTNSPFAPGNWLNWLHIDVCTRTVTTLTVPPAFPKSATNVSLAITATNPDVDLFVSENGGSAVGPTWDSVAVTTSNGDISGRVSAAREVVTETTNGDSDLTVASAARVSMAGSNGDVSLTVDAAASAITARATNGKVRITAPGDWTYSAQTTNGDVKVDGREVKPDRKGGVVSGTMGDAGKAGGKTMNVATTNGDVKIQRA
ncbi:hypothetical protein H9P43_006365 [Blastocladiella emersonii ATCC 22665]|nr:hypothetical protein H9P43_006365 [Blastocladiella emersonii ATCC 22665]